MTEPLLIGRLNPLMLPVMSLSSLPPGLLLSKRKQSRYPPKVKGKPKGFATKDLLFELKDA